MLDQATLLANHGYGVLLIDLRAHGESEGEQISFGKYETRDLEAAYQFLLTRPDVNPDLIGELGNSMGAVTVLLHASQNPHIRAVVADSPFAALKDSISKGVESLTDLPAFPFAPLIEYYAEQETGSTASEVAPVEHIAQISPNAVFLLQGGLDDVLPIDSGQRLYDAALEPKELWYEPQVGHTGFIDALPQEYEQKVIGFLDRYLLQK